MTIYLISGVDVAVSPPLNANDDLTDEDSGTEDNPTIDNLPGSQLNANVLVTDPKILACLVEDPSINVSQPVSQPEVLPGTSAECSIIQSSRSSPPPSKIQRKATTRKKVSHGRELSYEWTKDDLPISNIEWPLMTTVSDIKGKTPLQYFQQFFDEEIIKMMVTYTNQYAAKRNRLGDCTEDEMMIFIAVLLLSGYIVVPRRKMYWQVESDSHNELVSSAISRDRFDFIMSNIHVCNNDDLDKTDRFAKVRKLLSMLNERFQTLAPHERHHSIDESMVPYFGRHGCKQFIKGKYFIIIMLFV